MDLQDGRSVTGLTIRLRQAAELEVRVNDPLGVYFLPCDSPAMCSNLIIGVRFGLGGYLGADKGARDEAGGITYKLLIPREQSFGLWVFTRDYTLIDESGNLVIQGVNGTFTVPAGVCKKRFSLTITGRAGD